jgi:CBS-domain-containing membrane protein
MTHTTPTHARLVLRAQVARDVMSSDLVSLEADANLSDALSLFVDRGFGAAPVIDTAGRAIGVLAKVDILTHQHSSLAQSVAPREILDRTQVSDLMSPVVYKVQPETPIWEVLEQFRSLKVHHLFVEDRHGILLGVISTIDILERIVLE